MGDTIGVPATMWAYRDGAGTHSEVRAAVGKLRHEGARWVRVTKVDGGFWVEGWASRPDVEGPFDPPTVPAAIEAEIAKEK
jgi:hypothetical protein